MDISYYKSLEPLFGSWHITKLIGEGSFGKVFEIERVDENLGRKYLAALKVISIPQTVSEVDSLISEGMDEDSVTEYFKDILSDVIDEYDLMSELKGNSYIVSCEDYVVIPKKDGVGWDILIRMELLTPLVKYLKENELLEKEVIKLGINLCRALESCQQYNIIHRDIKPENIFISKFGDYKLGDFGIARTVEKTTSGLSKKGTYNYMAPEVYHGQSYGKSVDIYSVGIVMFRLLNKNRAPFIPENLSKISYTDREKAIARRMKGEPIPRISGISDDLWSVIEKASSFRPEDRYSTPKDMRRELQSIYDNMNVNREEPVEKADKELDEQGTVLLEEEITDSLLNDSAQEENETNHLSNENAYENEETEIVTDSENDTEEKTLSLLEELKENNNDDTDKTLSVYETTNDISCLIKDDTEIIDKKISQENIEDTIENDIEKKDIIVELEEETNKENVNISDSYKKPSKNNNRKKMVFILMIIVLIITAGIVLSNRKDKKSEKSSNDKNKKEQISIDDSEKDKKDYKQLEEANVGDIITFGHYNSSNEWIVLDKQEDLLLIISKDCIEKKEYNEEYLEVTWKSCSLRYWLNNDYYNEAFSAEEKARIVETVVGKKNNNHKDGSNAVFNTIDYIFLLSLEEANTYFKNNADRVANYNGRIWWWLRSSSYNNGYRADIVDEYGYIDKGGSSVHYERGVRPALWISIE